MSTTIQLNASINTTYLGFYGMCGESGLDAADTDAIAQRIHLLTSQYDDGSGGASNGNRTDLTWSPTKTATTIWDSLTNTGSYGHAAQYKYQFRCKILDIKQIDASNAGFDQKFDQQAAQKLMSDLGSINNTNWEIVTSAERFSMSPGSDDADIFEPGEAVPSYTGDIITLNLHNWWHMLPGKLYQLTFQADPEESTITIPELYCTKVTDLDDGLRLTDECIRHWFIENFI